MEVDGFTIVGLVWVDVGDEDEVNSQVKGDVCVGILSAGDDLGVTSSKLEEGDSLISGDNSETVCSIWMTSMLYHWTLKSVPTEYGWWLVGGPQAARGSSASGAELIGISTSEDAECGPEVSLEWEVVKGTVE
ncbi:hypothetical protein P691DRAFT_785673 [Macrolepiota fuliginosa MF-IS2]|uniref:Uncharacterized protein n=1 Tax=Macrolepiota fuliginosa MF-IS2 TaxID=1400762 RepID=A0A9P5WXL5_9AGAR|nr:hypothetical protein P691DRAFT_785673 [Macrolepiota fuliginosa MF-IS2]